MTTDIQQESLQSFIARTQLTAKVLPCGANPNMEPSKHMTRHFSITIDREGFGPSNPMHIFFSQGSGHKKNPTLADVLDCIASDASSVENTRNFDEWASELGYDTDSRSAEKTYRVCCEQRDALKKLLGVSFNDLLNDVERL